MADATAPARDRVLDAFQALIIEQGERAATLDAVAAAAGVSKGGLLYHFGSKEELVEGLLTHLDEVVAEDLEQMRTAPEGAVEYFLRTSVASESALDRAMVATARLAQGQNDSARAALQRAQAGWLDVVLKTVEDPVVARIVMLVSDGLYYNSALRPSFGTEVPGHDELNEIVTALDQLLTVRNEV